MSTGMFRGATSYIAGGLPSQVAYFVAYKESKERAEAWFGDSVPPVVLHACCGVFADLLGAVRMVGRIGGLCYEVVWVFVLQPLRSGSPSTL
jgi:hypothetical protein